MYQMTDAALAEAQGYCILHHTVVEDGCSSRALYSRVMPSRATELTAVLLDRNITAILGHRRAVTVSRQRREELAAIIHLCGARQSRSRGATSICCPASAAAITTPRHISRKSRR